jgi:hypothetical protein
LVTRRSGRVPLPGVVPRSPRDQQELRVESRHVMGDGRRTPPNMSVEVGAALDILTTAPHDARVYDYLLGGKSHFAADRDAAQAAGAECPGGLEGARAAMRANRTFLTRVVRWLATEAQIRQFLDLGAGIPGKGNVHEVAQGAAGSSRVVYVDNNPIVLAHAHQLLASTPRAPPRTSTATWANPT